MKPLRRTLKVDFLLGSQSPLSRVAGPEKLPLLPFRGRIEKGVTPIRMTEVNKAIGAFESGKAVGPEELSTELFRKAPAIKCVLTITFNAILSTARIPMSLLR